MHRPSKPTSSAHTKPPPRTLDPMNAAGWHCVLPRQGCQRRRRGSQRPGDDPEPHGECTAQLAACSSSRLADGVQLCCVGWLQGGWAAKTGNAPPPQLLMPPCALHLPILFAKLPPSCTSPARCNSAASLTPHCPTFTSLPLQSLNWTREEVRDKLERIMKVSACFTLERQSIGVSCATCWSAA